MSEQDNKSDLEKEFQAAYDEALPLIEAQIQKAEEAIAKAQEIANKYGVPFSAGVSPLSQGYIPASFEKKYSSLDTEIVSDITGVYDSYGDGLYAGWQHSAVC